jgi:hypothetical protein
MIDGFIGAVWRRANFAVGFASLFLDRLARLLRSCHCCDVVTFILGLPVHQSPSLNGYFAGVISSSLLRLGVARCLMIHVIVLWGTENDAIIAGWCVCWLSPFRGHVSKNPFLSYCDGYE